MNENEINNSNQKNDKQKRIELAGIHTDSVLQRASNSLESRKEKVRPAFLGSVKKVKPLNPKNIHR